jgi:lipopolysaccharide/colanic/teichoic acid biosynthesis glycosyltransferase
MQIYLPESIVVNHCVHPSATSKVKRLIDVLGALVGLAVTAFLLGPIAIAIRLDSPGALLYHQTRYGLCAKPFKIWKFRSMVVNAEAVRHLVSNEVQGQFFKNKHDPRITRVGRFLRWTSLDELPQFWNVLKGEMSLVGTRPPTADEVSCYQPHHFQRLLVKPGITGEWQVNGRSTIKDFEEVVRLDLQYQQRWSVGYDLILVLKTLKNIFKKNNAF